MFKKNEFLVNDTTISMVKAWGAGPSEAPNFGLSNLDGLGNLGD